MIEKVCFFKRTQRGYVELSNKEIADICASESTPATGCEQVRISNEIQYGLNTRYEQSVAIVRIHYTPTIQGLLANCDVDAVIWRGEIWQILEYQPLSNIEANLLLGKSK